MEVNVTGTVHLLEMARTFGVPNFIFASSSSVYGTNSKAPFAEKDPVDHPISPYAASKRSGELLAFTYSHLHAIKVACLRFFTVYGPRQRPDLAIFKFTQSLLKEQPIQIYGDGTSQRDYTYISDIVDGISLATKWIQGENAEKNQFEIFNLGESQTIPLHQLVSILEKSLNKKAKIKHVPYLPGDVPLTYADLTHSKEVLGYQPKVKIEEGIKKFCEWYLKIPQQVSFMNDTKNKNHSKR
jgi:UDP-glucuronate 4-epimerase